ncbi:MAG: hypothetical protein ACW99U_11610 [Candidatus Thorarchaeota archaeon]
MAISKGRKMLSPRKEYFDEPLVRANSSKVRFPKVCPVCNEHATSNTRVTIAPTKKQYLRPEWDPSFYPSARRRMRLGAMELKTFVVPVCSDHLYADESTCRPRVLCMVADGICLAGLLFALMTLGNLFWLGYQVTFIEFWPFMLFGLFMTMTFIAFRPNAFQTRFRIVGFDTRHDNVLFDFKNKEYREAFLKENPMTADLVNWVIRS